MQAAHVILQRNAEVSADASRTGNAGRILIIAEDTLAVADGRLAAITQGPGNAGEIVIRAGRLDVTEGGLIAAAQDIPADAPADVQGSGQGGRIHITATAVHVGGRNPEGQPSRIEGSTDGSGAGGAIDLQVHTLAVTDGGFISTGSNFRATGAGGLLRVTATGDVTIAGSGELRSRTFGRGRGGDIEVRAARVRVMDGGRIDTRTVGTDPEGDNAAGAILIEAGRLEVTGGGQISTASTVSSVDSALPTGAAGTVRVVAPEVLLAGQGSQLTSATAGTGQGGDIVVQADRLLLTEGGRITSQSGGASQGGAIMLQARTIELREGATITAESQGTGNAGRIALTATDTFVSDHSVVTTEAMQADGGEITVQASRLVQLRQSALTATVGGGAETVGGILPSIHSLCCCKTARLSPTPLPGAAATLPLRPGSCWRTRRAR